MSLKDLLKKNKDDKDQAVKQPADQTVESSSDDKADKQPSLETAASQTTTDQNKKLTDSTDKAYQILLKPLITEKLSSLAEEGKYAFVVDSKANKVEIAKAIKAIYGIWPEKVNVMNYQGKRVRFGRVFGRRRNWKKAIITLPKGKTIDIYKGV